MGSFIDTRWQLMVTRLGILAFKIAIIVILILAVVTPVTGGVKVNMPDLQDGVWTFENGTLELGMTVEVYNGGMFDVNDFYIGLGMTAGNDTSLADATTDRMTIRSGQWNDLDLRMVIDMNSMNETALRDVVFNETKINMLLDVGATYPLGWVSVNIGGNSSTDWQPLVKDYSIDVNNINLAQSGGQRFLTIPYSLDVSEMISGAPMTLNVTMRNASGIMSGSSQQITLQPQTSGIMNLYLSESTAQYLAANSELLYFDLQADIYSASVTKTYQYQWSP